MPQLLLLLEYFEVANSRIIRMSKCMRLIRSILLIVTLVTQALPVGMLIASAAEEKCTMSCCAEMGECGCAAAPSETPTPAPASLPPAQDREITPQVVWAEMSSFHVHSSVHADNDSSSRTPFAMQTVTGPHVRLTVLFCSFLT